MKKRPKAVVVGGSIAGIACAHSLLSADWDVVLIEKSRSPPTACPTGAGVGLDPQSSNFINTWLHSHNTHSITLPLSIDQNQLVTDGAKRSRTVSRDEEFNFRAAYWADLHALLYSALPSNVVVLWGHFFLSFSVSDDMGASVSVKARVLKTGEIVDMVGDLLVGADGCLSSIRQHLVPNLKLRYSGYAAWRGVLDFSMNEESDTIVGLRSAYPDLGKCLYFDLGFRGHCALYELKNTRINWIWYVNQPEPDIKGNSVTMKVSTEMIEQMHKEAEETWVPELVRVMKETSEPFVNVIYDCDPLEQVVWDNVVLVGDAAHPTTPHGLRSTNMSILDAAVLGQCLNKCTTLENLGLALKEYEMIRLPVTSRQVLHSRRLGRIKQGLDRDDPEPFNPFEASMEDCQVLQQKSMPFFMGAPTSDDQCGFCERVELYEI
ncbi:hypothetical protein Scep_008501 [Stephania cephalantha]|uniref:FAD-binding domain-containing protein n=1 Tax=Stephania cephalantha TaxID=152367 RepID=A0AAP0KDW4_9MAGN